jgi:hypothetical protein
MRKQACVDCHFFVRNHRGDGGQQVTQEVSKASRDLAANDDLSWQRHWESLACHKGIWDEGVGFPGSDKVDQISSQDRRKKCYFFKYQPGMLLPAAVKLREEAIERSFDLQKHRLAVIAIVLTLVGTIVGLVIRMVYQA